MVDQSQDNSTVTFLSPKGNVIIPKGVIMESRGWIRETGDRGNGSNTNGDDGMYSGNKIRCDPAVATKSGSWATKVPRARTAHRPI